MVTRSQSSGDWNLSRRRVGRPPFPRTSRLVRCDREGKPSHPRLKSTVRSMPHRPPPPTFRGSHLQRDPSLVGWVVAYGLFRRRAPVLASALSGLPFGVLLASKTSLCHFSQEPRTTSLSGKIDDVAERWRR